MQMFLKELVKAKTRLCLLPSCVGPIGIRYTHHQYRMLSAVKLCTPVPLTRGGNPLYAAITIRPIRPLVTYGTTVELCTMYMHFSNKTYDGKKTNLRENFIQLVADAVVLVIVSRFFSTDFLTQAKVSDWLKQ